MATFTMTLREVLERTDDIGLDSYPIFDEQYRAPLNQKIIDHYINREIGLETIDMFIAAMRRRMNEIMPLYNQWYTTAPILDPYLTFRSESRSTSRSKSDSRSTVSGVNSTNTGVNSDALNYTYPQTQITPDGEYADTGTRSTTGTDTTSESTSSDDGSTVGESDVTQVSEGFQGSLADLLIRYRETFVNIDMEVIKELDNLFMGVWNNSDTYTQEGLWEW